MSLCFLLNPSLTEISNKNVKFGIGHFIKDINELKKEANNLFGKKLVTPQTGPAGKQVQRLYIEEASEIDQEFYPNFKRALNGKYKLPSGPGLGIDLDYNNLSKYEI